MSGLDFRPLKLVKPPFIFLINLAFLDVVFFSESRITESLSSMGTCFLSYCFSFIPSSEVIFWGVVDVRRFIMTAIMPCGLVCPMYISWNICIYILIGITSLCTYVPCNLLLLEENVGHLG